MKAFKWRILLAIVNVGFAVAMCELGLVEYEADHRLHPGYFYHGSLYYLPTAQIVLYCLNMPAYFASGTFSDLGVRYISGEMTLFSASSFFHVYDGFFVAVSGLWRCVGWHFDRRSRQQAPYPMNTVTRVLTITGYSVGLLTSLVMLDDGVKYVRGDLVPQLLPIFMILWGAGLSVYFSLALLRSIKRGANGV